MQYEEFSFSPRPKNITQKNEVYRVSKLSLECSFSNGDKCPAYLEESFDYYSKIAFDRQEPYSVEEYNDKFGAGNTIGEVIVKVEHDSNFEINATDEQYTLEIENSAFKITAASPLGAIHAFQTLSFGPYMSSEYKLDEKYYDIQEFALSDEPSFGFRGYTLDGAGKFVAIETVKQTINAVSLAKINVIIFRIGGLEHFPIKLEGKLSKRLITAAFSAYHYYTIKDLEALEEYARSRGVLLIPEIIMPGGAGPFRKVDFAFATDCPTTAKANHYNIAVNPFSEEFVKTMAETINELTKALFSDLGIPAYFHLSGEEPANSCWQEDEKCKRYVKEHMIDYEQLSGVFYSNLMAKLNENVTYIVNEALLSLPRDQFLNNTIIDFTVTKNKGEANTFGFRQIEEMSYGLHEMHPNGGHHYFYSDTWMDLRQEPNEGSNGGLGIGGSMQMPADNCWDESCLQHAFSKGMAPAEVFWGGGGNSNFMQRTGCKIYRATTFGGPLEIGAPCLGY